MLRTPTTNAGSGLPAIKPLPGGLDGAPLVVSAVAAVSVNPAGSEAVYVFASTPVHIRMSKTGEAATVSDPPVPAGVPVVFYTDPTDRVSVVKMAGHADGTCWVHAVEAVG